MSEHGGARLQSHHMGGGGREELRANLRLCYVRPCLRNIKVRGPEQWHKPLRVG